jgi:hypothetical protein
LRCLCVLLGVLCSCTQKRTEKQPYGDFLVEIVTTERKQLFWPGTDFVDQIYKVYYKGDEVDFNDLTEQCLVARYPHFQFDDLVTMQPFVTQNGQFYCLLEMADTLSVICALYAHHNQPRLAVLIPDFSSALISVRPDTLSRTEVLYGNFIVDEQTLQVHELPVIQKRYSTYNDNYSEAYATFLYGVSPDGKWIVRSFPGSRMSSQSGMYLLFVTNRQTGQSLEFPLEKDEKWLVDNYNEFIDPQQRTPRQWFDQNFEWTQTTQGYRLAIRPKSQK